jgi:putative AlgH/UPF0301 family transcriptional regulator
LILGLNFFLILTLTAANSIDHIQATQSTNDDTTDVITGLVKCQKNIAKVQGKKVMTVGGPSETQAEAMLRDLKMLPPEELEKVTRELVTGLVHWNENIQEKNQAKGTDGEDISFTD